MFENSMNGKPKPANEWCEALGLDKEALCGDAQNFFNICDEENLWGDLVSRLPGLRKDPRAETGQAIASVLANEIVDRRVMRLVIGMAMCNAVSNLGEKEEDEAASANDAVSAYTGFDVPATFESLTTMAHSSILMAMVIKQKACIENRGPADMGPFALYAREVDKSVELIFVPIESETMEEHDPSGLVFEALRKAKMKHGSAVSVSVISDIYVREYESEEERDEADSDISLGEDFINNPNSNVSEAICAVVCDEHGRVITLTSVYRRDDDGMPYFPAEERYADFGLIVDIDCDSGGDRGRIIHGLYRFMAKENLA
jgi:hypothetical protein